MALELRIRMMVRCFAAAAAIVVVVNDDEQRRTQSSRRGGRRKGMTWLPCCICWSVEIQERSRLLFFVCGVFSGAYRKERLEAHARKEV